MEEKRPVCSFCGFIGKLVLKLLAVAVIYSAVCVVLEKVFHKYVTLTLDVEDINDENTESDCDCDCDCDGDCDCDCDCDCTDEKSEKPADAE